LGIDRNNRLFALQKQLSQELMLAGFSIDKREYRPHLTLGRRIILNQQFNQAEFSKLIKPMQIEISKISLMKSERLKGKLTYTEIYAKKLRNDS
jgi:2'-5' RNA ligase